MDSLGTFLRKEREQKDIALETLSEKTRVPLKFLQAMEEDRWDKLPSLVYIQGYLRSYALYLGLSPEKLFTRYKNEILKKGGLQKEIIPPPKPPKYKKTFRFVVTLLILLLIIWLFVPSKKKSKNHIKKTAPLESNITITQEPCPETIISPESSTALVQKPSPPLSVQSFVTHKNEEADHLKVARIYICKGIKDREPRAPQKGFIFKKPFSLFCFTEIEDAGKEYTIKHVWYHKQKEIQEIPLCVRGKRWRTWSRKLITEKMKGNWKVDILDEKNKLLSSISFTVY